MFLKCPKILLQSYFLNCMKILTRNKLNYQAPTYGLINELNLQSRGLSSLSSSVLFQKPSAQA